MKKLLLSLCILILPIILTGGSYTINYTEYKPIENIFIRNKVEELPPYNQTYEYLVSRFSSENKSFNKILDSMNNVYNGVWRYNSGEYHLGVDYESENKSNIYSPINGYIIQEDHSCKNNGYLGSNAGKIMSGGGNTIYLIGEVDNIVYGFIFMHCSEVYVRAGDFVKSNDIIGLVGRSGNSESPHCHLEMYKLGEGKLIDYINKDYGNSYNCKRGYEGYKQRCSKIKKTPCILNPQDYFN